MRLQHLELVDFRSYEQASLDLAPEGLTVVTGANGQGKTNLLEAIAWLATLSSFRNAPVEAIVRTGAERAVVRAEGQRDERRLLLEAELPLRGRVRVQINRQPVQRSRDLLGAMRVSVFTPDDLVVVKGGPEGRRRFVDEALVALSSKEAARQDDLAKVLRQRAALLKGLAGTNERRLDESARLTLDVFDARLASTGAAVAAARAHLVERLVVPVGAGYDRLAGRSSDVGMTYASSWGATEADLAAALAAARSDDLRRGVSTVGPHRDDVVLTVGGMPARTHASQGEQRSLALALRLAVHEIVSASVGSPPVLLLDDVFSELDPDRTAALVANLPRGQALLTTAGIIPEGMDVASIVRLENGRFAAGSPS